MASDAEVDLLVNASNALRDLERDLDRLINTAEANADPVLIAATLDRTLALRNLRRDLDETIRTAQADAPDIHIRADVDVDDAERRVSTFRVLLNATGQEAGRALGPIAALAGGLAGAGAAAGTAAPLLAGVVVAVESILPAAALATSGLLTLQLASATLKIGMIGVKDAIATAFDPDASPEDLAKSLEKLGPHAKSFVKELQGMRKGFKALQIDVQNRLFANLDTSLERLGKSVLPSVHGALDRTADSLNDMAKGAAAAAQNLGESGVLGSALASSTGALSKLERVPGQVVTAFGQLAASAGPAMEGLATRVAGVADRISEKLSKAFESGALEKAINEAVSNIDQLGRVAENIFGGIGNIIKAVTVDGEGLFGTLEKVSQAFENLTASKEFQSALQALSQTMNVLVTTLLPILAQAFRALLPVIEILAPPIQKLIEHLGPKIEGVIIKLGPVLEQLATAFGKLIPVLEPILDLGLKLITAVLPILTVLFEHLGEVFERWQPILEQVAQNLAEQLEPVLAALPGILEQILPLFLDIADRILPLLLDVLVQLGPELGNLSRSFADLLVELTPLLVKFLEFQVFLLDKMMPIIGPLAALLGKTLVGALLAVSDFIQQFVIPAVRTIVALLEGDFRAATLHAAEFVNNLRDNASRGFESLKSRAIAAVSALASQVLSRISSMKDGFIARISELAGQAVDTVAGMAQRIVGALGSLGLALFSIGQDMINGLISGILSKIGGVIAAAKRVADAVPDTITGLLGITSPSTVAIGISEDFMDGLEIPLSKSLPSLRKALSGVALTFPQAASPVAGLSSNINARPAMVNVYLGNERLTRHIDYRIDRSQRQVSLLAAQGVRR